ncbi:MAG: SDR family oxidoreductase [Pseudomonadota bacterium]
MARANNEGRRTVVVTGGGAGVGRAMADAFAATGDAVHVVDVSEAALAACPETWGRHCFDVTNEARIAAMMNEIGGCDVLCANAGTAGPTAPVTDVSLDDWRACTAVNLDAAFLWAKHAAPKMRDQGWGSITITSSTAGLHGYSNRSPYCASKWAVIGLAKTLALELGPFGVRANAICPGSVSGPRMDGVIAREAAAKGMTEAEVRGGYTSGVALRTFVEPEDIANMAVFLASDAGRYVTGQALSVDGYIVNPEA